MLPPRLAPPVGVQGDSPFSGVTNLGVTCPEYVVPMGVKGARAWWEWGALRCRAWLRPPGLDAAGVPAGSRAQRGSRRREGERRSDRRGRKMGREIRVDARGAQVRERGGVAAAGGGVPLPPGTPPARLPALPTPEAGPGDQTLSPNSSPPSLAAVPTLPAVQVPSRGPVRPCPEFCPPLGSSIYFLPLLTTPPNDVCPPPSACFLAESPAFKTASAT